MIGIPDRDRSLTKSSAVCRQYTNVTDGQTEGQTDTRETAKTALTTVKLDKARYSCILFVRLHLPHHTHSSSASTSDFFSIVSFFSGTY